MKTAQAIRINNYEEIKNNLRLKVFDMQNVDAGDAIFKPVDCGYGLLAYIDIPGTNSRAKITFELADALGRTADEIFSDALKNARIGDPARLSNVVDVLMHIDYNLLDTPWENMDDGDGDYFPNGDPLLILTTESGIHGASALFYPGILEAVADEVEHITGEGDYYILPSSIHEVLIYPCTEKLAGAELAGIVQSINSEHVLPEEQLGNRVMFYDATERKLLTVC